MEYTIDSEFRLISKCFFVEEIIFVYLMVTIMLIAMDGESN